MSAYICEITITGDQDQLSEFKLNTVIMNLEAFTFANLIRIPIEFSYNNNSNKLLKVFNVTNLIEWKKLYWGTTGVIGGCIYIIEETIDTFKFEIETYYDAPIIWFTTVSKMYSKLNFDILYTSEHDECGGGYSIKNGTISTIPGRLVNVDDIGDREVWFDTTRSLWRYRDDNTICDECVILKFKIDE